LDVGRLPANTTIVYPVKITRIPFEDEKRIAPFLAYAVAGALYWKIICGIINTYRNPLCFSNTGKGCTSPTVPRIDDVWPGEKSCCLEGGPGLNIRLNPGIMMPNFCPPCAGAARDCFISFIPVIGCLEGLRSAKGAKQVAWEIVGCLPVGKFLGKLVSKYSQKAGKLSTKYGDDAITGAQCGWDMWQKCIKGEEDKKRSLSSAEEDVLIYARRLGHYSRLLELAFPEDYLLTYPDDDQYANEWIISFIAATSDESAKGIFISQEEQDSLMLNVPSSLSSESSLQLIQKWNRTQHYWSVGILSKDEVQNGEEDFIDYHLLEEYHSQVVEDFEKTLSDGFADIAEGWVAASNKLEDYDKNTPKAAGVCATVVIKIEQELTITRTAFEASLEVDNGGEIPLENFRIALEVFDSLDNNVTHLFAIGIPTLNGISSVDGTDDISPRSVVSAKWLLIPRKEAAPTEPVEYFVGGKLHYLMDGLEMTRHLFPDSIMVQPDPALHYRYYLERIVYS
jgi:hypothetical protein